MKKIKILLPLIITSIFFNCNSTASDEFDDVNGNVTKKLIKTITSTSSSDLNTNIIFTYNNNNKLVSISNNGEIATMVYNTDGSLSNASSNNSSSNNVENLYQSPYNAFEVGEVIEYDNNGNPSKLRFFVDQFVDEFDSNTNTVVQEVFTAELSYDNAPNPFFYTLDAAGIIDVLDGVQLNLNMNPQASEVIQARLLFPLNNLSQIIYKNEDNIVEGTLTINYNYDSDNYPTSGVGTSTGNSSTNTTSVNYTYL